MTRALARAAIVAAIVGASFVACARGPKPSRPAPTAPATPTDSARLAAAKRDSAARADSARRAAADTTRRDTAHVVAGDTSRRTPPRARRRNADDPTSRCRAVAINDGPDSPPTSRLQNLADANGMAILFVGGGVVARCKGIRNRLQADSAEYYQSTGLLYLINNVVYDEPSRVHLTSNRLTYYTAEEKLVADGNVFVTLPTGTTMTGPNAEYLREAPALRDRSRLTAIGRPTLRVVTTEAKPRDATTTRTPTAQRDTATIIANTILDEGDSLVYASGQVQIVRTDVTANADSATFDQGTELARLVRNAQIQGTRGRPFTLSGSLVDLYSRERELTRVVSRGSAHVVSEDLDLKSDTVDLRVRESRVERAFAWGPSRAVATSPERDVVADSIEAVMPAQRIRELHALRRAVARSVPDTTRIVSKDRDLLAGDTIVARFDTLAAARDTTRNPPVRQIVASGHASSLYQIASSEGRAGRPSINVVRGRLITVAFDSNQVQTVTVTDSAAGVYFEPVTDSTAADTSSDSASARPRPTPGRPGSVPAPGRPNRTTTASPLRAPNVNETIEVSRD